MNGETQDEPERSFRGLVWLCWLAGILVLYVLSTGPVLKMVHERMVRGSPGSRFPIIFLRPMDWIGDKPLLTRPIRVYWHLWVPEWYDSKGNPKPPE